MAHTCARTAPRSGSDIDRSYALFPRLGERRAQLAGSLSGGEQQMLAVARALMSRPRLLLLDEPSLGLAPLVIQGLFDRFNELNQEEGVTMFIVEQNANLALDIADRAYVLEAGRIVLSGSAAELRANDAVRRGVLGLLGGCDERRTRRARDRVQLLHADAASCRTSRTHWQTAPCTRSWR